ncbi:MAG: FkbM family methyltransferase [Parcubacteria group bacterium]|jgi:FkbM family methyltransferase
MEELKLLRYKNPDFKMYIEPVFEIAYDPERFELATRKIFSNLIKPESNFVDVGAHFGFYSLLVSKIISSGNIFSFEPVERSVDIFKRNIVLNGFKGIKIFNFAISDKKGKKDFYISALSDSCGFTQHPRAGSIRKIKIETNSLDNVIGDEKIDVVKIDTEGHEVGVILGMKKIIANNPKIKIILEFNPKCIRSAGIKISQFAEVLKAANLEIHMIKDSGPFLINLTENFNKWEDYLDEISYANLLCLKKEERDRLIKKSEFFGNIFKGN